MSIVEALSSFPLYPAISVIAASLCLLWLGYLLGRGRPQVVISCCWHQEHPSGLGKASQAHPIKIESERANPLPPPEEPLPVPVAAQTPVGTSIPRTPTRSNEDLFDFIASTVASKLGPSLSTGNFDVTPSASPLLRASPSDIFFNSPSIFSSTTPGPFRLSSPKVLYRPPVDVRTPSRTFVPDGELTELVVKELKAMATRHTLAPTSSSGSGDLRCRGG